MTDAVYFDKSFELRYFEMNALGLATPAIMLALLEETAAEHCYAINYSLFDLLKKNIGWVLFSGVLKMERYPRYKERITIRTWLSNYSTIKGYRENLIFDENQNIIGRAKGLWVFFDIEKRRPTPIYDTIISRWSYSETPSITTNIRKKIQAVNNPDFTGEFKVHRFDTDMNKHLNNIRYLQWVIETIPETIVNSHFLHVIDGRFIAEAQLGDTVVSFTEQLEEPQSYRHSITVKGTSKVCATATTIWKPY
ncbi:acyl-[acyl-carrier-protein] thioesterase [Winogradskyella arenosi]|uniref:Acyl-ACP thioesterase-like protein n=1 Tax=Winogradskyella arenosi TaxID=533325 RepID=A0A368ZHR0_9FLAO|nr:acyl-ACP thioesterase domain-containing protein [Winogradskyella arenosi]RCW90675.1 acyl-ACP thioesterase-like protein [Winogradskyella arenosi]